MQQPLSTKKNGQINIVLKKNQHEYSTLKEPPAELQQKIDVMNEHIPLKQIETEMDKLIGLQDIKEVLREMYAWLYVNEKRREVGLKESSQALHMMFRGNPGTGKTTVAKLLGKLLKDMNILTKGHLIEAERADLVGEYIGHTAQKTRQLIKKSLGGILFIDEAYSLARGGEKDFGKEAIDTLVAHMEEQREHFILILAGYPKEMEHFLSLNPGLKSRFPIVIDFPDYKVDELMEIATLMFEEREYDVSTEASMKLKQHLAQKASYKKDFSNGRYVRNIVEKAIRSQAIRLLEHKEFTKKDLMTIRSHDLSFQE
ncbi:stage V sporulation protein K [Bacillus solimangrovi]|uniref:Stage V sporulation protein K n=1 Tax=Bacillus solimangrovi TaxID=1305675 RepID=A0A1E5LJ59_9BACI|nr:stage V sporulation protein K [Bacillus solimangrovi]OEH94120.1 stage V sporulation protein K [Bacillus solimangrovi]